MTIDDLTTAAPPHGAGVVRDHVLALGVALRSLEHEAETVARWGTELALRLTRGQRLLAAGNGGSAAEAQHLTAELVGRFDGERTAFSAIALHAETSAMTAIANDYGFEEVFARQVRAHGREGDVLMLLSSSGRSPNLVRAAETARERGIEVWSLTGSAPNPLAGASDECIGLEGTGASVQEAQLVAVHAMCRAFDRAVRLLEQDGDRG